MVSFFWKKIKVDEISHLLLHNILLQYLVRLKIKPNICYLYFSCAQFDSSLAEQFWLRISHKTMSKYFWLQRGQGLGKFPLKRLKHITLAIGLNFSPWWSFSSVLLATFVTWITSFLSEQSLGYETAGALTLVIHLR